LVRYSVHHCMDRHNCRPWRAVPTRRPPGPKVALHVGESVRRNEFPSGTTARIRPLHNAGIRACRHNTIVLASVYLVQNSPRDVQLPRFATAAGALHSAYVCESGHPGCRSRGIDPPSSRGLVGARCTRRAGRPLPSSPHSVDSASRERGIPISRALGLPRHQLVVAGMARNLMWHRRRGGAVHRPPRPLPPDSGWRGVAWRNLRTRLAFDRWSSCSGRLSTVWLFLLLGNLADRCALRVCRRRRPRNRKFTRPPSWRKVAASGRRRPR